MTTMLHNIYIADIQEMPDREPGVEMVCDLCGQQIIEAPNIDVEWAITNAVLHIQECTPGIRWHDETVGPEDINVYWPDIWTSIDGTPWRRARTGGWQRGAKP